MGGSAANLHHPPGASGTRASPEGAARPSTKKAQPPLAKRYEAKLWPWRAANPKRKSKMGLY